MIRLSPDDVLTVVSLYQQQLYSLQKLIADNEGDTGLPPSAKMRKQLESFQFYLPEDPA